MESSSLPRTPSGSQHSPGRSGLWCLNAHRRDAGPHDMGWRPSVGTLIRPSSESPFRSPRFGADIMPYVNTLTGDPYEVLPAAPALWHGACSSPDSKRRSEEQTQRGVRWLASLLAVRHVFRPPSGSMHGRAASGRRGFSCCARRFWCLRQLPATTRTREVDAREASLFLEKRNELNDRQKKEG